MTNIEEKAIKIYENAGENRVLMFNLESLANKFLNNFRDLIEQAKYLI